MFPHERSLVEKFANRPFALVGVNCDESPFELKRNQEKSKLTWPSFWDGKDGSIASNWGVDRYPTFFIIDRENIVRYRCVGVPPEGLLEQKIEEALKKPSSSKEAKEAKDGDF